METFYQDEIILQYRVFYKPSNKGAMKNYWSLLASSSSLANANEIIDREDNSHLFDYKVVDSGLKKQVIQREIW
tara:strand:- start:768 stop:989 length:222 start_codon:yes stop_codon:yes gene_type:complete